MATWEESFNGRHWYDMPGNGADDKKLNFAAWRRGLIKMEEIKMDEEAADGAGMALVTVPTQTTGLARANHRRAIAAAKKGRAKVKRVVEWRDQLTPSQRKEKAVRRQQQHTGRLYEKIKNSEVQQSIVARWKVVRSRAEVLDKPLQMLRRIFAERGGSAMRAEGILHGCIILKEEAEARLFNECLTEVERLLNERDELRKRANALGAKVDLKGVRGIDFCRVCGVSDQLVRDLRKGCCRASGEKLVAMVRELERLAARAKAKAKEKGGLGV